jgi:hypothetical protein
MANQENPMHPGVPRTRFASHGREKTARIRFPVPHLKTTLSSLLFSAEGLENAVQAPQLRSLARVGKNANAPFV